MKVLAVETVEEKTVWRMIWEVEYVRLTDWSYI